MAGSPFPNMAGEVLFQGQDDHVPILLFYPAHKCREMLLASSLQPYSPAQSGWAEAPASAAATRSQRDCDEIVTRTRRDCDEIVMRS